MLLSAAVFSVAVLLSAAVFNAAVMVCVGQADSKEQAASVRDRVTALAAQIDDSGDSDGTHTQELSQ